MKDICIRYRCRKPNRGMILLLMLVLAALTSLLATSNLERTRQRTLLDDALAIRVQTNEVLTQALHQGIVYAHKQLKIEDFDSARPGIYKTVDTDRWKSDYRRFARPAQNSIAGMNSGFWVELFSTGLAVQSLQGKHYLSCRLLVSSYAEGVDLPTLFSQALVETTLPTSTVPTSDTKVIKVESLVGTKVIATKIFN